MIFYFTATGNSKFIANRIAAAVSEPSINIAECMEKGQYSFELSEGEGLGFVVPVFYYGIPMIVSEFLSRLQISATRDYYSYAVLNCGSTTGDAGRFFKRLIKIDAVFGIKTVDNYVPMFSIACESEITERLDNAEHHADNVIDAVKKKVTGIHNEVAGRLPRLMTSLFYPLYSRGRKTKKFRANGNCDNCGLCEKVCPRRVISLADRRPVWNEPRCEICLACLHRCPAAAIEYGKSAGRGQFVNPRVEL